MARAFVPPPSLMEEKDEDGGRSRHSPTQEIAANSEAQREEFYASLLTPSEINMAMIRRYARKGIPEKLRAVYWKILLGYLPRHPADWRPFLAEKREHYRQFVVDCNQLTAGGSISSSSSSSSPAAAAAAAADPRVRDVHRIDVDIPRTMPSLHFFACEATEMREGIPVVFSPNQESLRRILHTMSKLNLGIGYVQGMNELVGHLLFTFATGAANRERQRGATSAAATVAADDGGGPDPLDAEADVFFCFQGLLSHIADNFCRVLDFDRSQGVSQTIENYRRLLEYCDPELAEHLEQQDVKPEFYAFRWVTLLLSQEFVVPDVLRLWDYLFSFCEDVNAAVYFTAVAMAIHQREELLQLSFGPALILLQQYPPTDIADVILVAQSLMDTYGLDTVNQVMHPRYQSRAAREGEEEEKEESEAALLSEELGRKVGEVRTRVRGFFDRLRRRDTEEPRVCSGGGGGGGGCGGDGSGGGSVAVPAVDSATGSGASGPLAR